MHYYSNGSRHCSVLRSDVWHHPVDPDGVGKVLDLVDLQNAGDNQQDVLDQIAYQQRSLIKTDPDIFVGPLTIYSDWRAIARLLHAAGFGAVRWTPDNYGATEKISLTRGAFPAPASPALPFNEWTMDCWPPSEVTASSIRDYLASFVPVGWLTTLAGRGYVRRIVAGKIL